MKAKSVKIIFYTMYKLHYGIMALTAEINVAPRKQICQKIGSERVKGVCKGNHPGVSTRDTSKSKNWIRGIPKRNPILKEKFSESQERSRSRMSNWTVMRQYFSLRETTVAILGLSDKLSQIFNCDENGISGKD